jgi:L-lactate dehydrogenase complex protein LldF
MAGTLPPAGAPWKERRDRALADTTLRGAVSKSTHHLVAQREAVDAGYPRGEEMRGEAQAARRASVARLDELVDQAARNVEARGGHVTRAAGPADVASYVLAVARRRGARRFVKSKSMATEEVDLNARLEAAGMHVRETDLGEYIIQLAHERPSHIIVPALHKTRGQIRTLFEAEASALDVPPPEDESTPALTAFARRQLRAEFLAADIGISGGNYLIAETGTLVLITNEGNGRMSTSLPPVHIAVVGIDKILASWDDLAVVLQQAPLSATGQRLTTYISLISGPRGADELDGPEEFHLILLDNGRHEILGTEYEDVLACIRCGACLNVCPVFRTIGGHAYGSMYSGPIGVVLTPLLGGLDRAPELPKSACSLCHACRDACPMAIELPQHIVSLRHREVTEGLEPRSQRFTFEVWSRLWATPAGYRRTARLARLGQRAYVRGGKLGPVPPYLPAPGLLGGWLATRDAPPVAAETFHEWWSRRGERGGQRPDPQAS